MALLTEGEWADVGARVRKRLGEAGIAVKAMTPYMSEHPLAFSRIEVEVLVQDRRDARQVVASELGSDFVVDYYTHLLAVPQNVVYVFPADRAWSKACFGESNVRTGRGRYPSMKADTTP